MFSFHAEVFVRIRAIKGANAPNPFGLASKEKNYSLPSSIWCTKHIYQVGTILVLTYVCSVIDILSYTGGYQNEPTCSNHSG